MSCWQRPESRFGPCTIIGMYCLADMRRSRTITCWTICAIKCARREQIRIATDGDADRFGIVDGDGTFLRPNYVIAKLFDYLIERRGWKNGMAKSVATTDLINAIAKGRGVKLYEAPWFSNTLVNRLCLTRLRLAERKARGYRFAITWGRKTECWPGLLCCEMVARG